jgi:sn-glycerol 3-phosphate transport system substrate-binding protein
MKYVSRYALRLVALAMVLAMFIVPAAAQDKIVVDFYYPTAVDGNIDEIIQRYAEQFEAMHPDIDINAVYTGSYTQTRDTIQTELAAGDVIVDVAVMLATDLYSFTEEESVVPAQQFIDAMDDAEAQAFVDNMFPAFMFNGTDEEGTIWTLSFQRSTPLLYYNADLFEQEGVEVPTNVDELIAAAQKLQTPERAGFLLPVAGDFPIWLYQSFAAAYGQALTEADPTTVYLDTPESLEAVTTMTKMGMAEADGGFAVGPMGGSVWGDTPPAFNSGQAAMIYHTAGSLSGILANATFNVGVANLPSGPAGDDGTGYGAPTGGGNLYIFAAADPAVQEAAWEWAKYLASDEIQSDWSAATGYIAATRGAWDVDPLKSLAEENPQYLVARDQLEYAVGEFSSYRSIDVQNIINVALSEIISGSTPLADAQTVLTTAQQQIDSLLEEYK